MVGYSQTMIEQFKSKVYIFWEMSLRKKQLLTLIMPLMLPSIHVSITVIAIGINLNNLQTSMNMGTVVNKDKQSKRMMAKRGGKTG